MTGTICRHTRRKSIKPFHKKMSSADDNLEYVPLEMTASVPDNPTKMTTFYLVNLLFTAAINFEMYI